MNIVSVAGAMLLRHFQKVSCSFRGTCSTLETSIVILRGRRSTSDVSHCVLKAPHSTLTLRTLHSTLYTLLYTLHFTLYSPYSTLHTLHSTLHTSHSTLYTVITLHTYLSIQRLPADALCPTPD